MYVDDTSVTCSAEDIDELRNDLKTEMDNIAEWLRQNKLSLNTDKQNTWLLVTNDKLPVSLDQ